MKMSEGYVPIGDDTDLGLLHIITSSYQRYHLDYRGGSAPNFLPILVARGKSSKNILCKDEKSLRKYMYWNPGGNLITPPVICVDVDSRQAIRETFIHLRSAGFDLKPSAIIINTRKGTAQFQWFLDAMYCHVGKNSPKSMYNDSIHTTMFREVRRSMTMMLHGDECFMHERMRNPYHHDDSQQVLLLNGAPRLYGLEQMKDALMGIHGYITDASVAARYNMKALISRKTRERLEDEEGTGSTGEPTIDDFVPDGIIPIGSRNHVAYRSAFAAAMHHINPGEVIQRMDFEGDFPVHEKDEIAKNVIRAARRRLKAQGDSTAMSCIEDNDVCINTYDSMHRSNRRHRTSVSPVASSIASGYGRMSAMHPSERQLETRSSNLTRGVRSSIIRHAMLRHDVMQAIMDMNVRNDTDMMLRKRVANLHHIATYSDEPCAYMSTSIRNTRRELQKIATAWLINNHTGYDARRIRRIMQRQGVIRGTRSIMATAEGTGFISFMRRHGIIMDDDMAMNTTITAKSTKDSMDIVTRTLIPCNHVETTIIEPSLPPDDINASYYDYLFDDSSGQ